MEMNKINSTQATQAYGKPTLKTPTQPTLPPENGSLQLRAQPPQDTLDFGHKSEAIR